MCLMHHKAEIESEKNNAANIVIFLTIYLSIYK